MAKSKSSGNEPHRVNENLVQYGDDVRVERGAAPGELAKVEANPNHRVRYVYYVFQTDPDTEPTETSDGAYKEVAHFDDEEAADAKARSL